MTWSFDENAPIYIQIVYELKQRIISGQLKPGEKMPSVRELAQEAGVNPNTMQRALSELEREELIYTVRTSGRFVTVDKERICQTREHLAREKIRVLLQDLLKLGFLPDEIMRLVKDTRESMTEE